jgi:hypothetical protein
VTSKLDTGCSIKGMNKKQKFPTRDIREKVMTLGMEKTMVERKKKFT